MLRKSLWATLVVILLITTVQQSRAILHGSSGAPAPGISIGNIGSGDIIPANFSNMFKASQVNIGTNSPTLFDSDGYPTGTLTAAVAITFSSTSYVALNSNTVTLQWTSDITSQWTFLGVNTGCSPVNATVSGCVGGNVTITTQAGLAGSVTFTASTLSIQWPSGFTYARTAGGTVSLSITGTDLSHGFSSQYRTFLKSLKLWAFRSMGITNSSPSGANLSTERWWKYRAAPSSFSWANGNRYLSAVWGGQITGTDVYTLSSLPSDVSAGAWASGETIQGYLGAQFTANSSASTTLTVTNVVGVINPNNTVIYVVSGSGTIVAGTTITAQLTGPAGGAGTYTTSAATTTAGATVGTSPTRITVSGAVNNGSGLCRLTVNSTAALTTGQQVWAAEISDNVTGLEMTACSGLTIRTITVIDSVTIDLQGTTFSGTYKAGTGLIGTQTLVVAGKSAGPVFMATAQGFIEGTLSSDFRTGNITCWYDEIIVRLVCTNGGISSTVPIEAQAQLANDTGSGLYYTLPAWANDDYALNAFNTVCQNLNSNLPAPLEYGNEIWNNGFPTTSWASQRGVAMGFPQGSNESIYGWYGLRVREIMGNILPTAGSCVSNRVSPVLAYQAAGGSTISLYRFGGADLAPLGTSTGKGNSVYIAYTGGANYTTVGNRPGDKVTYGAFAPYAGGANLCTGGDIGCTPNALNAPFYQALVNAWEAGSSATAIALVDDDIRQGRTSVQNVTASGTTFTTPAAHGFVTNSSQVAFQVTGGTSYSGLTQGALYRVSSTSNTSCPGGVICNFTIQGFSAGFVSGSNINAGTAGSGTVTVGWVGNGVAGHENVQTMQALNSNWYQFAQSLAVTYNIQTIEYEGNPEPQGPTTAQCAALGVTTPSPIVVNFTANVSTTTGLSSISISPYTLIKGMTITGTGMASNALISKIDPIGLTATVTPAPTGSGSSVSLTATGNCGTDIAQAITAWKNDASAKATIQTYYNQSLGLDSTMLASFGLLTKARAPSHLVLLGSSTDANDPASNLYGLVEGNFPSNPPSPVFQTYCGVQAFNGGSGNGC